MTEESRGEAAKDKVWFLALGRSIWCVKSEIY